MQEIFNHIQNFTNSHQDELILQQQQLTAQLEKLQTEMQELINDTHFQKDKQYILQFEKINENKKRLEAVNTKMQKIQLRVDTLEKRLIKVCKD
ncbi:hypothetical protein pb186bvf_016782 [Paramecium bursaria]